jgi:hypothetical protein
MTSLQPATASSSRPKRKRHRGRSLTVRKNATNAKGNHIVDGPQTRYSSIDSSRAWDRFAIFGGSAWSLVIATAILGLALGILVCLNTSDGGAMTMTRKGVELTKDLSLWSRALSLLGFGSGLEYTTNHQDIGWRRRDCLVDKNAVPALYPGDLSKLFQGIAANYSDCSALNEGVAVTVHSSSNGMFRELPWILTLENFLSSEECDILIKLGYERGFQRSMDVVQPSKHDKETHGKITTRRTSESAWCTTDSGCRDQEIPRRLQERISHLLGIPKENSEDLQILKYDVGECEWSSSKAEHMIFAWKAFRIRIV